MFIFRFPEKIPIFFYLIFFFLLICILVLISPIISQQDLDLLTKIKEESLWTFSEITNLHFLILKTLNLVISKFPIEHFQILRVINLFYLLMIVLITFKIIKLKFYDLDIWNPIGAFLISGGIIFSILTIQDYILSGLLNLVILYFLLKIFEENKITNIIFLNLFCTIALLMGNFYCLVIITLLFFIKIFNFKLEKEKKLSIISNISFLYILAIAILIINKIGQDQFINIDFLSTNILERIIFITILLLPLTSIFLISLFFNLFRKLNWNKDLIFFLLMVVMSMIIFILSPKMDLSLIVFTLPLISIYIFRTLEFVQMKWTKFIYLFLFIIPFLIIYTDTSFYQKITDIPYVNYIFYSLILLLSFISPIFLFQARSILDTHKTVLFSLTMIVLTSMCFFYYQYNSLLIQNVITQTLKKDFQCLLEESKIGVDGENPLILSLYFKNNINPNFDPSCHIQLTFSSLANSPINDINSVNKTILDLNQKLFVNINFKKL